MTALRERAREVVDLRLIEADYGETPINGDGTADLVLLRPCATYPAGVLERDAPNFLGWPVYLGEDTAAAARGGLPRPVSELAGEIRESFWEPGYTAGPARRSHSRP